MELKKNKQNKSSIWKKDRKKKRKLFFSYKYAISYENDNKKDL